MNINELVNKMIETQDKIQEEMKILEGFKRICTDDADEIRSRGIKNIRILLDELEEVSEKIKEY